MRIQPLVGACLFLVLFLSCDSPATGDGSAGTGVVVNGKSLSGAELKNLRRTLSVPDGAAIPRGKYWYDPFSGLWGKRGGPTMGQIPPGLDLGGPLRADASGGKTGVFINGREIHPQDLAYLQRIFGTVNRGRYWLDARGVGGYEGGPPQFSLWAESGGAGTGGGGSGGYTRRTPFGGVGGDSNCSYYLHPGGSSVMTCK